MHSSSVLLHTQQQQQQQIVQGQNNNVLKRGKALGHGLQEDVLGSADGENRENGVENAKTDTNAAISNAKQIPFNEMQNVNQNSFNCMNATQTESMQNIDSNYFLLSNKVDYVIKNRIAKSILFRYPRFAIKSYGKEKRYLCPPPHIALHGNSWDESSVQQSDKMSLQENMIYNYDNLDAVPFGCSLANFSNGFLAENTEEKSAKYVKNYDENSVSSVNSPERKLTAVISIPGIELSENSEIQLDESKSGYATRIFIPESRDVNKSIILNSLNAFSFSVSLLDESLPICSFSTDFIKLKSKALSYSKQAINNSSEDMCLVSGSTISLYSRIHAHKSNTRFLYTEDEHFTAHPLYWDSFIIFKVPKECPESEFDVLDGVIYYGDYVKIVSTKHNISLPAMQIFPIELKSNIEMKPVQYLSRCSFRFRYNQTKFLCISSQKNVVGEEATVSTKKNTFKVREEAIWTITKISSTLYSYFELEPSKFSISPFPYVQSITLNGSSTNMYLKLSGLNFSPLLTVWLGKFDCTTYFQCKQSLIAVFPKNIQSLSYYCKDEHTVSVPVILMRRDFVLYPTQLVLELHFNSLADEPNDFVMECKYAPFDTGLQDPEIYSKTILN